MSRRAPPARASLGTRDAGELGTTFSSLITHHSALITHHPSLIPTPLTVTLLGTGTSTGVPVIGCSCRVCTSADPRDKRLRVSAYIEVQDAGEPLRIVIDTGPDFRRQALEYGVTGVDAVLFTHHHFDHVVGMDDLRPFLNRVPHPIQCFASPETARVLGRSFGYIFDNPTYPGVVRLEMNEVDGPFEVRRRDGAGRAVRVIPVPARHGDIDVLGYRVGRLAFLTDVSEVPDSSLPLLRDIDVLVLDGLRMAPHPTHLSIPDAVETARRIGARRTFLVHMTHDVPHAEAEATLPAEVRLGVDGMVLEVSG